MTNQMHGKVFENRIKSANDIFSYSAADRAREPNAKFDIGAEDDTQLKIPTSIKSTGSKFIGLSDARNFWESLNYAPYRIIVGHYNQEGDRKKFYEISMFVIEEHHKTLLLGEVSISEIADFHNTLTGYGYGKHDEARAWAQSHKLTLQNRLGVVMLNPKIDTKTQRRLQCGVNLENIKGVIGIKTFTDSFGNMPLPLEIINPKRSFNHGNPPQN